MRRLLKWLAFVGMSLVLGVITFILLAREGIVGPPGVPADVIAKSVNRDAAEIDRAFALPAAAQYGRALHWQANGSYCGPASLVNVYRSFGDTVEDEAEVLDGTGKCSLGICWMGLTLDELAEVARHETGHPVTVLRDLTPEDFTKHLRQSNQPDKRYIVNFTRREIFGAGGGHHSPIGGYLEEEDLVLVLDVNADFKPWLVERERLFKAMDTLDGEHKRGLLLIE